MTYHSTLCDECAKLNGFSAHPLIGKDLILTISISMVNVLN